MLLLGEVAKSAVESAAAGGKRTEQSASRAEGKGRPQTAEKGQNILTECEKEPTC